jgi:peptide/nickel transport system permease protein
MIRRLSAWGRSAPAQALRAMPGAWLAAAVALACLLGALGAGWLAPFNPFDLGSLDLADSHLPPAWLAGGGAAHWLGTDEQGRDLFSALLYGMRISLAVGLGAVALSLGVGVAAGLLAGWAGGWLDALLMRACDVMLAFPSFLLSLMVAAVGHTLWPEAPPALGLGVLVLSIALAGWVPYARTVRAQVLVERGKDYVLAARVIGVDGARILRRHVLPNVLQPVWVLGTLQVAQAIVTESTLSFLGVGVPPTSPSLGTLIRTGNDALLSGEWWVALFPGLALLALSLSLNLLGDALRDAFDPRLQ